MQLRASCLIAASLLPMLACHNDPPPQDEVVSRHKWDPRPRPQVNDSVEVQAPVDMSLGAGLEVRRPVVDGRLTLIPIVATQPAPSARKFITLGEGMASGQVTVREVGESLEVDQLWLRNNAKEPLLVLRGQLVIEGEQDRVMSADRVIEPGQSTVVAVRCVEQDRAEGYSKYFKTGKAIAEPSLRRTIAFGDQDQVWEQVDVINAREKTHNGTRSYRLAAQAQTKGDNLVRRDRIVGALSKMEERDSIVGFAVAVDNKVVAVERFASADLYRKLEPELLASYVMDASGTAKDVKIAPDDVRTFVAKVKPVSTVASTVYLAR